MAGRKQTLKHADRSGQSMVYAPAVRSGRHKRPPRLRSTHRPGIPATTDSKTAASFSQRPTAVCPLPVPVCQKTFLQLQRHAR